MQRLRMVGENADAGANVGAPVVAEDDDGDILTYTLARQWMQPRSRSTKRPEQITVGDDTELDAEGQTTATRSWSRPRTRLELNPATITVTINVSDDVNEPPAITGEVPASFNEERADNELTVVTFTATDPDPDNTNTDITWSLSGPDAGDFTITTSGGDDVMGALTFKGIAQLRGAC